MSGETDFSIDLTSYLEKNRSCEPEVRELRARVDEAGSNWNEYDRWRVIDSDTIEIEALRHFEDNHSCRESVKDDRKKNDKGKLTSFVEKNKSWEPEMREFQDLSFMDEVASNSNKHESWPVHDSDTVEIEAQRRFEDNHSRTEVGKDDHEKNDMGDWLDKIDKLNDGTKTRCFTIYLRTGFWESLGTTLQERKVNFLDVISQGVPGEFPMEGSEVVHSFHKTKGKIVNHLILSDVTLTLVNKIHVGIPTTI